ncbi:MAG: glucose-1-phosphate adenylyltransferase [Nitrospinae bacterium]|nr:glucose-1-phosphate adenylyltransferase [Nitrospinota bacterium]
MSTPHPDTLAIILGGGKGSRLFPLTEERCKPAVPLGGKYRLIDVPISNCINSGLRHVYVVTQYMSASLNQHIAQAYVMDVFSKGFVSVLAATQQTGEQDDWFQGTADAIRKCMSWANIARYKRVVILSGDQLYKMNYNDMLQTHEANKAAITIGVLPVERKDVEGFGIMRIDQSGAITEFVEKPKTDAVVESLRITKEWAAGQGVAGTGKEWLASMGIYVFETKALIEILKEQGKVDFGKDVIPDALTKYKTQSHLFNDYWEDIGTIKSFFEANLALGAANPPFDFYGTDAEKIFTNQRFLMASRFGGAHVTESVISDGCVICQGTSINRSVIGIRSRIGKGANIDESIVMGADFYERPPGDHRSEHGIGAGVMIKRAIIDKNVSIGDGAKIVNAKNVDSEDGENYYIREGIVIIPKNAHIPPGTII